ncbi:MAG: bifunctional acetate--CoA ligase family protein/GNAT family N-acetyltransferase [Desulfotignum sp.]|jgi:acetyltransferase|nr:bifunctional acetate--CoA ligase family protein/GNAT family N-acetyltransferase [Desulfotignum sp.]
MGIYNLDRIFQPESVAVIGATETENSIGNALMTNLGNGGFSGKIVPVNPEYATVKGIKTLESIRQSRHPIDLAIIATPISTVPDIVEDCIAAGTGGAVIISAGGKETGDHGRDIEKTIQEKAYAGGLRLVGPNCLGIINTETKLNASFASDMPSKGKLAFVSQSGAICTSILDLSFKENIGFSHFVSIGSMVDVDFGDMIDYLGNDSRTGSILLYIENLTRIRKFMSAARAVSRIKPIVVLKAGRSEAGARAASSHTGALAGEDAVYDAAFKRAGIIRVKTIAQLFDCAELMAKPPRPRGSRLAIITNGGGPGVMATDALADHGLKPAPLSKELTQGLDDMLPPFWSRNNPIDILGDATRERFIQTVDLCRNSRSFDGILTIMVPQALTDPEPVAEALAASAKEKNFPIFASWIGGKKMETAMGVLNQAKIPTYETPERAIQAFVFMVAYNRNLEMLTQIPRKLSQKLQYDHTKVHHLLQDHMKEDAGFLSEAAAKEILSAYGIPVNTTQSAATEEEAVSTARKIGFPVALKLISPDISHKTDARGVHLNLQSDDAVQSAFGKIMEGAKAYNPDAHIEGVSVQQHIDTPDYELLIGAKSDVSFGPVIVFGSGGIFTEILEDRSLGLPPLNRLLARRMMEDTRVFTLLKGFRNRPPADMEALEAMLMRVSQLMTDFPQIAELDMNPVLVKDGHPWAVDARIRLEDTAKPSPMHLVISPYPDEYEFHEKTDGGKHIFVRPVTPEDASLFKELFKELSPTSIYHRFFSAMKEISPAMLARFTQIDYDRHIALTALDDSSKTEQMFGIARVITDPDGKTGEFSILIGDPWHGQGIGAKLLGRVLQIAKNRKIERVWGTVLRENRKMIALGKRLGFTPRTDTDLGEIALKIDLTEADFSFLDQSPAGG